MAFNQSLIEKTVKNGMISGNVSKRYLIMKRIFDITFSLCALIILSPLFIIVAIAIKIDSKGPVFFIQKRCKFNGEVFNIYKFRSMVANAPEMQKELEKINEVKGAMFKSKKDPRVTRVGKFIRKTSIDELPQLINVLKGEMSIVGPRPPIVEETERYDKWHYLRLSVKPGLTGLWQVKGRSTVGFEEMVRLDLKYIRERSFLYDLKIILKTLPVLFGDDKTC